MTVEELLAEAVARVNAMTPAELDEMQAAQRESWRRSLTPCEHGRVDFEQCFVCRTAISRNAARARLRKRGLKPND